MTGKHRLLLLLAAAAGVLMLSRCATAHDSAAWIQTNPHYLTASGAHCRGPNHCSRSPPSEVVRIDGGWQHLPSGTVLMDGTQGIYTSIDADLWRCFWGGKLQCVFWGVGT